MARKTMKQVIEGVRTGFGNMKDSTKRRIAAGSMAFLGGLGGLFGCTQADLDNVQIGTESGYVEAGTLESGIDETTVQVESDTYPVVDQTLSEQLKAVGERMIQILENQGVSQDAIVELKGRIDKCTTDEEMMVAINSMQGQIESYMADAENRLDALEESLNNENEAHAETKKQLEDMKKKVLDLVKAQGASNEEIARLNGALSNCVTLEQFNATVNALQSEISALKGSINDLQKPSTPEIEESASINLDAVYQTLTDMALDLELGVRTDYHETFIYAEKVENVIKQNASKLDPEKSAQVQQAVLDVQKNALYLITYYGVDKVAENGMFKFSESGAKTPDKEDRYFGVAGIDLNGRIAMKTVNENTGNLLTSGYYDGLNYAYAETDNNGKWAYIDEDSLERGTENNIYDINCFVPYFGANKGDDYDYNPIEGYSYEENDDLSSYRDERGRLWKANSSVTRVELDKEGGVDKITKRTGWVYEEQSGQNGPFVAIHSTETSVCEYDKLTPEQMNAMFTESNALIEQAKAYLAENGSESAQ